MAYTQLEVPSAHGSSLGMRLLNRRVSPRTSIWFTIISPSRAWPLTRKSTYQPHLDTRLSSASCAGVVFGIYHVIGVLLMIRISLVIDAASSWTNVAAFSVVMICCCKWVRVRTPGFAVG